MNRRLAAIAALAVAAAAAPAGAAPAVWVPTAAYAGVGWESEAAAFAGGTGLVAGGPAPVPGATPGTYDIRRAVYRTGDGGVTWSADPVALPFGSRVAFATPATWWSLHHDLRRTTNGGATWSAVPLPLAAGERLHLPGLRSPAARGNGAAVAATVTSSAPGTFCAADEADAVFWTSDGGATWDRHDFPAYASAGGVRVHSLDVATDDSGLALVWNDAQACGNAESAFDVYRTTDGGASWVNVVTSTATKRVSTATLGSDGTLVVGWADGSVGVSTDGGATFATTVLRHPATDPVPDPTTGATDHVQDVEYAGGTGYAVQGSGAVWRTTDAGATWTLDGVHTVALAARVHAFDADAAFTVQHNGVIVTRVP